MKASCWTSRRPRRRRRRHPVREADVTLDRLNVAHVGARMSLTQATRLQVGRAASNGLLHELAFLGGRRREIVKDLEFVAVSIVSPSRGLGDRALRSCFTCKSRWRQISSLAQGSRWRVWRVRVRQSRMRPRRRRLRTATLRIRIPSKVVRHRAVSDSMLWLIRRRAAMQEGNRCFVRGTWCAIAQGRHGPLGSKKLSTRSGRVSSLARYV